MITLGEAGFLEGDASIQERFWVKLEKVLAFRLGFEPDNHLICSVYGFLWSNGWRSRVTNVMSLDEELGRILCTKSAPAAWVGCPGTPVQGLLLVV